MSDSSNSKQRDKGREYLLQDRSEKFLDFALLMRLMIFMKPYWGFALFALTSLIFSQIAQFFFPHLLNKIIDGPIANKSFEGVTSLILIFLGLTLAQGTLYYLSTVWSRYLALNIVHDIRVQLYQRVLKYTMSFFHRTPVGRLMTRMTNDVDTINSLFSEGLLDLISSLLMIVFAIVFMLIKDWRLALTTLTIFPFMVIVTSIFRVKVRDINRVIRTELAALNSTLQENLNGIQLVQIFNKQAHRFSLFKPHNEAYRNAYFKNVKYYSYFFPALFTFSDFSLIACYSIGSWLILKGEVTVGALVAFAWYANMFHRPLREISDKITQLQSALAAGERVLTLLNTDAEDLDGAEDLSQGPLSIEFQNVNFGYLPEKQILHHLDLNISSGESVAIVGATGAGKSTLFQLLNRYYRCDSGSVKIGSIDITSLKAESLREKIANVSQDVFLFSESLLNNILLGAEYEQSKMDRVLEKSRVSAFLDQLPEGVHTVLKENASNLSAGQRQLISFARALYHDPQILLLDEATSSVDVETEYLIQQAMEEITKGRTSIIIAHRLSTVSHCDRIIVLEHGQIVEQGSHQELLNLKGHYYKLVLRNQWDLET